MQEIEKCKLVFTIVLEVQQAAYLLLSSYLLVYSVQVTTIRPN